jgi:hypothetical protein
MTGTCPPISVWQGSMTGTYPDVSSGQGAPQIAIKYLIPHPIPANSDPSFLIALAPLILAKPPVFGVLPLQVLSQIPFRANFPLNAVLRRALTQ